MPEEKSRLVYSTEQAVARKEGPAEKKAHANVPAAEQKVIIRIEKKGRGGKTVTVIDGLRLPQDKMAKLLKDLKARLGTGGTQKDSSLEIQGDHRDTIMSFLGGLGFSPKRSG